MDVALQKEFDEIELKRVRRQLKIDNINTALSVINTMRDGFVANKKLKDEVTDLAANVLIRELKEF